MGQSATGHALTILYLRPQDARRSAIAEYAEHFLTALRLIPGAEVHDVWTPGECPSEEIDSRRKVAAVQRSVVAFAKGYRAGRPPIIHVELGNALHREFWAGCFLSRIFSGGRLFATLHDPPRLCSNPYRYARTEFEGLTPVRLLNVALTRAAESLVGWRKRRVETEFLSRCEAVAALTRAGALALQQDPRVRRTRSFVLPHVFDLSSLAHRERATNGASKTSGASIVFSGFFAPAKGIEDLVDGFTLLCRRLTQEGVVALPSLLLFGGVSQGFRAADYLAHLGERIRESPFAERISLRPQYVSDEERDALLAQADVAVLPTRPTPGVVFSSAALIRYMALGKAIVAARANTVEEEVADGRNGLLYPPGDAAALADCLHRLLQDPALRQSLGSAARAHVEAQHSPARVAELLAAQYQLGHNTPGMR